MIALSFGILLVLLAVMISLAQAHEKIDSLLGDEDEEGDDGPD